MVALPAELGTAAEEKPLERAPGEPAKAGPCYVTWSGTSFSAPAVAGAIARAATLEHNRTDRNDVVSLLDEAVNDTIHDPVFLRLPLLGTHVNVT
jgi:subtilisin family serine protease